MKKEDEGIPVMIRYYVCKNCGYKDTYDKFPLYSKDGLLEHSKTVCPKCLSNNLVEALEEVKGWEEKLKTL